MQESIELHFQAFTPQHPTLELINYRDLFNIFELIGPKSLEIAQSVLTAPNKILSTIEPQATTLLTYSPLSFPKDFITAIRVPQTCPQKILTTPSQHPRPDPSLSDSQEIFLQAKKNFLTKFCYEFDALERGNLDSFWEEAGGLCCEDY